MYYSKYQVGKCLESLIGEEKTVFDLDDSGAMLFVLFNKPTDKEIRALKENVKISYVKVGSVFMMLFKFGNLPWMDSPYSPHLSAISEVPKLNDGEGIGITLVFADCRTGYIHSIRLMGLSHEFSEAFLSDIKEDLKRPFDRDFYYLDVSTVMNENSTDDLVAMRQRASCEIRRD